MSNIVPVNDIERMASVAAATKMFGFKSKEEAMAIMLLCQAEGLHPGIAMRDYHVIQGRPALKADAMLARFQQAGGKVQWHTLSDTEVSATFSHPSGGDAKITWTFEAARKIGLTGKDNWNKYPRAMLRARVVSEGVRTVYPGVVVGTYTPEEVQDMEPRQPQTIVYDADPKPPEGDYPVMVPGKREPYTNCPSIDMWVAEFNSLVSRILSSEKMTPAEKGKKIEALMLANQQFIDGLPEKMKDEISSVARWTVT